MSAFVLAGFPTTTTCWKYKDSNVGKSSC